MQDIIQAMPHDAHPMGVLVSAMSALSIFHPDANPALRVSKCTFSSHFVPLFSHVSKVLCQRRTNYLMPCHLIYVEVMFCKGHVTPVGS